jgi:hypothetical protein
MSNKRIKLMSQLFRPQYQYEELFQKRKEESSSIMKKIKNQIPVIVESYSTKSPQLNRRKFLVPDCSFIYDILHEIKTQLGLGSELSLRLYVKIRDPPNNNVGWQQLYQIGMSYFSMPSNLILLELLQKIQDVYDKSK